MRDTLKKKIARGTADPEYWVYNLSYLSSHMTTSTLKKKKKYFCLQKKVTFFYKKKYFSLQKKVTIFKQKILFGAIILLFYQSFWRQG